MVHKAAIFSNADSSTGFAGAVTGSTTGCTLFKVSVVGALALTIEGSVFGVN
jgi:hypothetical protein